MGLYEEKNKSLDMRRFGKNAYEEAVAAVSPEEKAYVDGKTGDLSNLTTTDKSNLVAAINEVKSAASSSTQGEHYMINLVWEQGGSGYLFTDSWIEEALLAIADKPVTIVLHKVAQDNEDADTWKYIECTYKDIDNVTSTIRFGGTEFTEYYGGEQAPGLNVYEIILGSEDTYADFHMSRAAF